MVCCCCCCFYETVSSCCTRLGAMAQYCPSASRVQRFQPPSSSGLQHLQLIFVFLVETGFSISQAGLELTASRRWSTHLGSKGGGCWDCRHEPLHVFPTAKICGLTCTDNRQHSYKRIKAKQLMILWRSTEKHSLVLLSWALHKAVFRNLRILISITSHTRVYAKWKS